jgi:hypothetical protein
MSTAIFGSDNTESPIQVVRSTMSVSLDDSGQPVVSFATNRGKGTGAQVIPVSQFAEAVECLQSFVEAGFESEATEPSVTDTIRSTIGCEDGMVSFRVRSGKGAKPARIPLDAFEEVISLLASTVEAVQSAGASVAPEESDED